MFHRYDSQVFCTLKKFLSVKIRSVKRKKSYKSKQHFSEPKSAPIATAIKETINQFLRKIANLNSNVLQVKDQQQNKKKKKENRK